eukprot:TRINITY_DN20633_c0_g2_i1.p1 TRINITY_DN20633_c0_g2~~TRINITY_DN20633_c0_g2_i1.p1  ORF type:complete len:590 (+),score=38.35 TRINITY_DN20633_c0_g2_i1:215-1984(+)
MSSPQPPEAAQEEAEEEAQEAQVTPLRSVARWAPPTSFAARIDAFVKTATLQVRKQPTKKLRSTLPPDLMRGVPTQLALEGYGRHWEGIAGGPNDYSLSRQSLIIEDFISHDWRTPRSVKYVTLCYIENRRAALTGSMILAALVVLAREVFVGLGKDFRHDHRLFPRDIIGFNLICSSGFIALLFHWHHLRPMLRGSKLIFLDKLCICQYDDDKKSQGILGLAAFLKHSKRLVVLWSPTYFSRLWCSYELAAWFKFENELSSILFVPVEIPARLVVNFCIIATANTLSGIAQVARDADPSALGALVVDIVVRIISVVVLVLFAYVIQGHIENVGVLQEELSTFEMQRTRCFCCSNNHCHPETGAPLSCDRNMVYSTLAGWLPSTAEGGSEGAHLTAFNDEVRSTLHEYVTRVLPERQLFLRYVDFLFALLPQAWNNIDGLIFRYKCGFPNMWLDCFACSLDCLVTYPLACNIVIRMMYWAYRYTGKQNRSNKVKALLSCFLWGPVTYAVVEVLRTLNHFWRYLALGVLWLYFIVVIVLVLATYLAFRTEAKEIARQSFSLSLDDSSSCGYERSTSSFRSSRSKVTMDSE